MLAPSLGWMARFCPSMEKRVLGVRTGEGNCSQGKSMVSVFRDLYLYVKIRETLKAKVFYGRSSPSQFGATAERRTRDRGFPGSKLTCAIWISP